MMRKGDPKMGSRPRIAVEEGPARRRITAKERERDGFTRKSPSPHSTRSYGIRKPLEITKSAGTAADWCTYDPAVGSLALRSLNLVSPPPLTT